MNTDHLSIIDVWKVVDLNLSQKLGKVAFSTFQQTVKPISFISNTLLVGVPNNFMKKWVFDKCDYLIKTSLYDELALDVTFEISISESIQKDIDKEIKEELSEASKVIIAPTILAPKTPVSQIQEGNPINPKYTFDNYVVGPCNRFAHAASVAVSKAPGKAYNPLFIYGGVGLGKTHLMHAIANQAMELNPGTKVLLKTSEDFTNDLITSLQKGKTEEFRNRYRTVDILLIDDIQFIAGKEKTEEEFFHTFNNLYQFNKQIVITSDRLPKDIPTIEERLKSRFEWGLSADLQQPELETRIAILYKKTEPELMDVPKDVIYYIASQIPHNVRELEGALIKIVAYASLVNQQISINLAKDVIKDIVKSKQKKPISLAKIKTVVSEYYDIPLENLSAKIRTKEIAHARQVAMYLSRDLTSFSLPKIGESFGKRDHTTVMHACDKIRTGIKKNQELRIAIEQIKDNIFNQLNQPE
jgi:chromosomal replication initiator protein